MGMLIGTLMTPNVVSCRADDTLERAAQLMWDNDLGFLPIVDRDDRVIGVLTDRDTLMAAYTRGAALSGLIVETAMAHVPVTCTIHDEATKIEHLMAERQIRRLPVIDATGRPVGIVTLSDLAQASLSGHELSPRGPTCTLAAITQPRRTAS